MRLDRATNLTLNEFELTKNMIVRVRLAVALVALAVVEVVVVAGGEKERKAIVIIIAKHNGYQSGQVN